MMGAPGEGGSVRVLTWNVHGCVGRDRTCSPHRIAEVLKGAQPDIAALQEIDARMVRELQRELDPFTYFGDLLGFNSLAAHTLTTKDGPYGHVLMSRWPLESLGEEDLSLPRSEPRKAIFADVEAPFGRLAVVAAHLGLLWTDRRKQLARLRARLAALPGVPSIVLGDFNDAFRRGAADRTFNPPLRSAPPLRTFPSRLPLLPLDRVWYDARLELASASTLNEAGPLSDHLPVLATFTLGATASAPGPRT